MVGEHAVATGVNAQAAVNPQPGIQYGFYAVLGIYAVLTVLTIAVLRRITRSRPVPAAPQERDVQEYTVT